jgi:multidrug efflux system membrane fusion protein
LKHKYLMASFIALLMLGWFFSGQFSQSLAEQSTQGDNALVVAQQSKTVPTVRGMVSEATQHSIELLVRGTTEVNRSVTARSEISGRVVGLPYPKGTTVSEGDVLCQLSVDSRDQNLKEARALRKQTVLEYKGLKDLSNKGLQSDIALAQAKARLESANAAVSRATLSLSNTKVRAPFNGIIEQQPVEVGDYLSVGGNCATVIEIDPILLTGQVAEKDIGRVVFGGIVSADLITGETVTGKISFISQLADKSTRAYRIEVEVPNPEIALRAGITSELKVPLGTRLAHRISPAVLVLDDDGEIGVRVVNSENKVEFYSVEIISEGIDGIWVAGLPSATTVITVGQEEVFEGQLVKTDITPLASLVVE